MSSDDAEPDLEAAHADAGRCCNGVGARIVPAGDRDVVVAVGDVLREAAGAAEDECARHCRESVLDRGLPIVQGGGAV